jgi:hypothetical protein
MLGGGGCCGILVGHNGLIDDGNEKGERSSLENRGKREILVIFISLVIRYSCDLQENQTIRGPTRLFHGVSFFFQNLFRV